MKKNKYSANVDDDDNDQEELEYEEISGGWNYYELPSLLGVRYGILYHPGDELVYMVATQDWMELFWKGSKPIASKVQSRFKEMFSSRNWKSLPEEIKFENITGLEHVVVISNVDEDDFPVIYRKGRGIYNKVRRELRNMKSLVQQAQTEGRSARDEDEIAAGSLLDLASLIPEKSVYDTYEQRTIGGIRDLTLLDKLYDSRKPLLMVGPTGSGKTHAVLAFCAKHMVPVKTFNLNGQTTVEDLVGQWVPGGDGRFVWRDGILVTFMKQGGVVVMDEINGANAEQLFVLHSILDDRRSLTIPQHRGETVVAHPNFWLVAAMNPLYEGTRPLNLALKSRFIKLEYDYDETVEKKFIKDGRLVEMASRLREMKRKGELISTISSRELKYFEFLTESVSLDVAIHSFIAGCEDIEQSVIKDVVGVYFNPAKQEGFDPYATTEGGKEETS